MVSLGTQRGKVQKMSPKRKVVIIGAGPAGLTAGYILLKQSDCFDVVILEEESMSGGISRTVNHNGNRMDLGGHRFFSKVPEVNALWEELLPLQGAPSLDDRKTGRNVPLAAGGPDPEKSDEVMLSRRRVSRIFHRGRFFDYPVKMNLATIRGMGLAVTFAAGCSWLKSLLHKLPETSLENFYINRFGRKLYSMFFEDYTEKLWGRHPRAISADWGAQRVKGLSICAVLRDIFRKLLPAGARSGKVETSLIEEFHYPKFGPGQLWETAAKRFEAMGGRIVMNCRAEKIRVENGRVVQVTASKNGETLEFSPDILLSSMPLADLAAGMNDIPASVSEIAAGLPYRDFVTVGLLVDRLNLKNETKLKTLNNIIPDCWIYVQDSGVKLGRIQIFNNWSPYLVRDPEHSVWLGLEYFCREGDDYWNLSAELWKRKGVSELISMGVLSADAAVSDFHVEKVRKAYPAYFDTYSRIDELIHHLNSIENLYCIGRNGQHRYNNMDHSMATAFEAVRHILHGGEKSAVWNVNTEREYHEERG